MRLLGFARRFVGDRRGVAVFATESYGSVGDQAMAEAVREHLTARGLRPTFVFMPGWTAEPLRADAPRVMLRSASSGSLQFMRLVLHNSAAIVIGADVTDGAYGSTLPLRWIGKLTRASESGAKVGIINFSFSPNPDDIVCDRLRASKKMTFTLRDPVSRERFTKATGQAAIQSADLAFLLTPELRSKNAIKAAEWLDTRKSAGDTILFVNLSGHTLGRMSRDGVVAMGEVLHKWLSTAPTRSVFLIPHDFRPSPIGDVEPLEVLHAQLAIEFPGRVEMIHPPFAAWDVKALCGQADLAISGRMHLAIACLGMGVPVISVVYVGKFEGLMQHLGLADENLLVSTKEATNADLILERLESVLSNRSRISIKIRSNLETVRALSARNYEWL